MKLFFEFLPQRLKKHKIFHEAKASLVLARTSAILNDHFSLDGKKFLVPWKFQNKKVYIKCHHSAWRQKLFVHKTSFLLILQDEFSKNDIVDMVLV